MMTVGYTISSSSPQKFTSNKQKTLRRFKFELKDQT